MEIWRKCKETGKEFKTQRGFLNHLRKLKMRSKDYYDKHYKLDDEGFCYCGNETTYYSFSYKKYCSDVCACRSKEHRNAVKNRFKNNPKALESFRKSRKNVDPNVKKRKETIKLKCEQLNITEEQYYSNHSKAAYASMTDEEKRKKVLKRMDTIEKTTGDFGGRSGYKPYNFLGEIVSLQGYEPIVLDCLIENFNLNKNDIMIGKSNIPIINYVNKNGENKMYFPDFYLPNHNLIIEVKSDYTYNMHKDNVHQKCLYTLKSGYSILLLVVSKREARNGKLEGSKNLLDWAISSQAPKPTWYGEGSTTILYGVESSDSKRSLSYTG